MTRGVVFPLSLEQVARRAEYLARERALGELDQFVVRPSLAALRAVSGYESARSVDDARCPDIFYKLEDYNGGKDPSRVDCAQRWTYRGKDGRPHIARTSDCIGGAAWAGGFDRKQTGRFPFYGGAINTDSMLLDACGPQKMFKTVCAPVRGCFVVYKSGVGGHAKGHIGVVLSAPQALGLAWSGTEAEWRRLRVLDVASRGDAPANKVSSTGWRNWMVCASFFVIRK